MPARRRCLEVLEQRLLRMHLGAELQVAGGRHPDRVGVDGLAPRKVRDGREGLGGFEDLEGQPGLVRFDRGRDARDAAADDREVEDLRVGGPRAGRSPARQDGLDGARPRVGGELEQRNARQVAGDPHARNRGRPVFANLRERLDGAGRPLRVEPVL